MILFGEIEKKSSEMMMEEITQPETWGTVYIIRLRALRMLNTL
jgi:hypothetical protein